MTWSNRPSPGHDNDHADRRRYHILFSALLASKGPPARIYEEWREKRFQIVTCPEQLSELRAASRYPHLAKAIRPFQFGVLLNRRKKYLIAEKSIPQPHTAHNPRDSFLLNLARSPRPTTWSPATRTHES